MASEGLDRWEDAAAADPAFQQVFGRVTGTDSAWVVPAPRELLTQNAATD